LGGDNAATAVRRWYQKKQPEVANQQASARKPYPPYICRMQHFETVVGLEVHIQLSTKTKLFCADSAEYGGAPNTHVSPITLAHPGTLPVLNKKAVEYAVKLGLALGSEINRHSIFDRKHYFYPDLPKGYQTSQSTAPILIGGHLPIPASAHWQQPPVVQIHHVHLEEDAGKSIHDADPEYSCIDLNRAGVPLLELVTEPCIRSSEEAYAFITELRKLVRWLGICDGNMEEGSLRCDANISIRPVGETKLGTKVEVKNLNSIRNVRRAIDAEVERQTSLLQQGKKIIQETRGYDADKNITVGQREKEEANDYRYLPCPDLPPFEISEEALESWQLQMPALPLQLHEKYVQELGLPAQDAQVLTEEKALSDYFNELVTKTTHTKAAANWLLGPVKSWLNDNGHDIHAFPLPVSQLAAIIEIVQSGKVNFSMASSSLLPALIAEPHADVTALAQKLNIIQEENEDQLEEWVNAVLANMPDKIKEYQKGKKGLIGLFVGEVKKISKGKADPKKTTDLLVKLIG
jgi:aspartyl-tRNA(Asn)/glutamyl-tRNA(Gln) amidotransferase subunit B